MLTQNILMHLLKIAYNYIITIAIQHTHACTHTHRCTYTHTHAHTHARTHTHTHKHTHTHTNTHTHTLRERERDRERQRQRQTERLTNSFDILLYTSINIFLCHSSEHHPEAATRRINQSINQSIRRYLYGTNQYSMF